jgi:hypothetical protein
MRGPWHAAVRAALLLVCATAAWSASADTPKARRRLAVVVYGDASAPLVSALHDGLAGLDDVVVQAADETRLKTGIAAELGVRCTAEDEECHRRLGSILLVDLVVAASFTTTDATTVDAFVVAATAADAGRVQMMLPADAAAPTLALLAGLLLQPEREDGVLALRTDDPSLRVGIDGAPLAPLPPHGVVHLAAGPHRLVVSSNAGPTRRVDVDVRAGDVTTLTLSPSSSSPPSPGASSSSLSSAVPAPGPAWSVVAAAGGLGVAALAAGGALGVDVGLGNGLGAADEKAGWQTAGQSLLVVAGIGLVVGGFGVVGLLVAPDPPAPR